METGLRVQVVGSLVLRYGLVLVIGWIGVMKFTEYEAKGIQPLIAHSPLMGWMYGFLTLRAFSNALGVVEVAIAILIGLRHWSAKACALGRRQDGSQASVGFPRSLLYPDSFC
jgi:reactive chlorine resistance protein C